LRLAKPLAMGDVAGVTDGPRGWRVTRVAFVGSTVTSFGPTGAGMVRGGDVDVPPGSPFAKMRCRALSYRACRSASVSLVGVVGWLVGVFEEGLAEGRLRMRMAG
jgi:hypothetical protein